MGDHFPNGWPKPLLIDINEDGDLAIEWVIFSTDPNDEYRIALFWDSHDGVTVVKTTKAEQLCDTGISAMRTLTKWLEEAKVKE